MYVVLVVDVCKEYVQLYAWMKIRKMQMGSDAERRIQDAECSDERDDLTNEI